MEDNLKEERLLRLGEMLKDHEAGKLPMTRAQYEDLQIRKLGKEPQHIIFDSRAYEDYDPWAMAVMRMTLAHERPDYRAFRRAKPTSYAAAEKKTAKERAKTKAARAQNVKRRKHKQA